MVSPVPTILSLDLGTTTGWCMGGAPHMLVSGVMKLKPGRFDSSSMRFVRFLKQLNDLMALEKPDFVVYEEVRRHAGTDAAHVYGGLMAHLQVWCDDNDIPYEGHPVGTIKKFATGKGNADKDAMIAAVKAWGHRPADDNEADAIALCRLKLAEWDAS
jgi:Holliday junction resolvasome RuvABC endonuclease subunit